MAPPRRRGVPTSPAAPTALPRRSLKEISMERLGPRLFLVCGAALGVFAALLIIPATSSVVRTQLGMVAPVLPPKASFYVMGFFGGLSQSDRDNVERRIQSYSQSHPNDYRV